ncbi:MAG: hypothetical protein NT130_03695 [Candidatus Micrarchaeota archaeon]|nr:hypothetical protein [Candidatus Micrarchaeota archaeon]
MEQRIRLAHILFILLPVFLLASPVSASMGDISICFPFFLLLAALMAAMLAQGKSPLVGFDISTTRPPAEVRSTSYQFKTFTSGGYDTEAKLRSAAGGGSIITRGIGWAAAKATGNKEGFAKTMSERGALYAITSRPGSRAQAVVKRLGKVTSKVPIPGLRWVGVKKGFVRGKITHKGELAAQTGILGGGFIAHFEKSIQSEEQKLKDSQKKVIDLKTQLEKLGKGKTKNANKKILKKELTKAQKEYNDYKKSQAAQIQILKSAKINMEAYHKSLVDSAGVKAILKGPLYPIALALGGTATGFTLSAKAAKRKVEKQVVGSKIKKQEEEFKKIASKSKLGKGDNKKFQDYIANKTYLTGKSSKKGYISQPEVENDFKRLAKQAGLSDIQTAEFIRLNRRYSQLSKPSGLSEIVGYKQSDINRLKKEIKELELEKKSATKGLTEQKQKELDKKKKEFEDIKDRGIKGFAKASAKIWLYNIMWVLPSQFLPYQRARGFWKKHVEKPDLALKARNANDSIILMKQLLNDIKDPSTSRQDKLTMLKKAAGIEKQLTKETRGSMRISDMPGIRKVLLTIDGTRALTTDSGVRDSQGPLGYLKDQKELNERHKQIKKDIAELTKSYKKKGSKINPEKEEKLVANLKLLSNKLFPEEKLNEKVLGMPAEFNRIDNKLNKEYVRKKLVALIYEGKEGEISLSKLKAEKKKLEKENPSSDELKKIKNEIKRREGYFKNPTEFINSRINELENTNKELDRDKVFDQSGKIRKNEDEIKLLGKIKEDKGPLSKRYIDRARNWMLSKDFKEELDTPVIRANERGGNIAYVRLHDKWKKLTEDSKGKVGLTSTPVNLMLFGLDGMEKMQKVREMASMWENQLAPMLRDIEKDKAQMDKLKKLIELSNLDKEEEKQRSKRRLRNLLFKHPGLENKALRKNAEVELQKLQKRMDETAVFFLANQAQQAYRQREALREGTADLEINVKGKTEKLGTIKAKIEKLDKEIEKSREKRELLNLKMEKLEKGSREYKKLEEESSEFKKDEENKLKKKGVLNKSIEDKGTEINNLLNDLREKTEVKIGGEEIYKKRERIKRELLALELKPDIVPNPYLVRLIDDYKATDKDTERRNETKLDVVTSELDEFRKTTGRTATIKDIEYLIALKKAKIEEILKDEKMSEAKKKGEVASFGPIIEGLEELRDYHKNPEYRKDLKEVKNEFNRQWNNRKTVNAADRVQEKMKEVGDYRWGKETGLYRDRFELAALTDQTAQKEYELTSIPLKERIQRDSEVLESILYLANLEFSRVIDVGTGYKYDRELVAEIKNMRASCKDYAKVESKLLDARIQITDKEGKQGERAAGWIAERLKELQTQKDNLKETITKYSKNPQAAVSYEELKKKEDELIRTAHMHQAAELLQREQHSEKFGGLMQEDTRYYLDNLRLKYGGDSAFWDDAREWAGKNEKDDAKRFEKLIYNDHQRELLEKRNEIKSISDDIDKIKNKPEYLNNPKRPMSEEDSKSLKGLLDERKAKQGELKEIYRDTEEADVERRFGTGRSAVEHLSKFAAHYGGYAILAATIASPFVVLPIAGVGAAAAVTAGGAGIWGAKTYLRTGEEEQGPYSDTDKIAKNIIAWSSHLTGRGSGSYPTSWEQGWVSQTQTTEYMTRGLRLDEYGNIKPDKSNLYLPNVGLPWYVRLAKAPMKNIGSSASIFARRQVLKQERWLGEAELKRMMAENPMYIPEIEKKTRYQYVKPFGASGPSIFPQQAWNMERYKDIVLTVPYQEEAKHILVWRQHAPNPLGMHFDWKQEKAYRPRTGGELMASRSNLNRMLSDIDKSQYRIKQMGGKGY